MSFDHETEYPDEMPPIKQLSFSNEFLKRLAFAAEISKQTESPIETMMGLALHDLFDREPVEIIPQFPWRKYRIDWVIRYGDQLYFIECDGNEFHTKPEDVARDQIRDAAANKAGIKVFRFTGAEIFKDADACAMRVLVGIQE